MLRPTSAPGSSDPSTMWSSRILVTRFFAIVHHPRLTFPNSSTHSTFSSSVVCPRTSRCIRSGAALARSWDSVPVDPAWCRTPGRPRRPPLLVAHDRGRYFEGLPIQGCAAPRTVRNLLGESLASVVVVEEHPLVLPTYPPELPPEIRSSRARTHQTSHRSSSSFANMCLDSNLHNKTCPRLWRP